MTRPQAPPSPDTLKLLSGVIVGATLIRLAYETSATQVELSDNVMSIAWF